MTDETALQQGPDLASLAGHLIAIAARAPSVHNTQPWRFRVGRSAIELYSDPRRKLRVDPAGREMLISCGAALFGLRLAVRSLGYLPVVDLLPDPERLRLLARVTLGAGDGRRPMTADEQRLLEAIPHRHTHRGAFAPVPLPAGLLPRLQHDAVAEGAALEIIDQGLAYQRLSDIVTAAGRRLDLDPRARAEMRRWSRRAGSPARDGIPAGAFAARAWGQRGRLRQRDFDLGRGIGLLGAEGPGPAVTAVLLTAADRRADWLRAGQALHRVLLRAASAWVFASLYTQPLKAAPIRDLIRDRLALPGAPQLLLQLGVARTIRATARRPPGELIDLPDPGRLAAPGNAAAAVPAGRGTFGPGTQAVCRYRVPPALGEVYSDDRHRRLVAMNATVRDVMTTNVVAVRQNTSFKEMAAMLRDHRVSAFPVIDEHGTVIGVVSEADLLAKEALDGTVSGVIAGMLHHKEQAKAEGVTAADLMSAPAVTVGPDTPVADAAKLMYARRVKRLPVVAADGHLVGIVSRSDVLSVYGRPDEEIQHEITQGIILDSFLVDPDLYTVTVTDGIVTIAGRPETIGIGRDIIEAARHVEGVVAVRDRLSYPPAARASSGPLF